MSNFWNAIAFIGGVTCVITLVLSLVIGTAIMMAVDGSQARYSVGDMVQLKIGVTGQVTRVIGENTGLPWDRRPEFEYRVRYFTSSGVEDRRFEDWEIE